jgi:hypothetical protein
MTQPMWDRPGHAWREMNPERRLAAASALALLVTMFFPWYGLQSVNRKTGVIYSHSISAFGDVSFVEAAIFLVAAGVLAMLLARAEGRKFHLPGGDGTIVMLAGGWAGLLIFYRVFDRPTGYVYPVGIEWGFFLAFMAAGCLAYAGWRMRAGERPEPPLTRQDAEPRRRSNRERDPDGTVIARARRPMPVPVPAHDPSASEAPTVREPAAVRERGPGREPDSSSTSSAAGERTRPRERSRYPPAPPEQLSFEDPPGRPR